MARSRAAGDSFEALGNQQRRAIVELLAGRPGRYRSSPTHPSACSWHPHELFRGLAIPRRALCRLHVLDELDERLAVVDNTVGLIARELAARCAITLCLGDVRGQAYLGVRMA